MARKTLDSEVFIERSTKIHRNKYDYSKTIYTSRQSYVTIICKKHGEFQQNAGSHLNGCGCRKCFIEKQTKTSSEFIRESKLVHGNKFDYNKVKYINNETKVEIICRKHGSFFQQPTVHLNGSGCALCAKQSSKEDFVYKASLTHGNKFDYSNVIYVNDETKVEIICRKHGSFFQMPGSHIRGNGCLVCRASKGEQKVRDWLIKSKFDFIEQKKFDECKYKRQLPFDFFVPTLNLCIEYDGEGHFRAINRSRKLNEKEVQENFYLGILRDKIKTTFCKKENISLLRIPYFNFDEIDEILNSFLESHNKKFGLAR